MKPELQAVQEMTDGLTATGMPDDQAGAVVHAIAEGIQSFAVTPLKLQEELAPIRSDLESLKNRVSALEIRVGALETSVENLSVEVRNLSNKMDAGFESVNSRMFWLTIALLGTQGAMIAAMISVLLTNAP